MVSPLAGVNFMVVLYEGSYPETEACNEYAYSPLKFLVSWGGGVERRTRDIVLGAQIIQVFRKLLDVEIWLEALVTRNN